MQRLMGTSQIKALVLLNIIPQIQNFQSQNCISIKCCGDSPRYFVFANEIITVSDTFKVRYSNGLGLRPREIS